MTGRTVTPVALADQAAEAIRALNHATLWAPHGYQWPSDVDGVLGDLALMAARLDQALRQADRWLTSAHHEGRVGHDAGGDALATVRQASGWMREARSHANELAGALTAARSLTNHLTGIDPPTSSATASGQSGGPS